MMNCSSSSGHRFAAKTSEIAAIVSTAAFGATGCVYQDLSDTCTFASGTPLYQLAAYELGLVIGSTQFSDTDPPFLVLYGPDGEAILDVDLVARPARAGTPRAAPGQRCMKAEVRSFDLAVDAGKWSSYWASAKEHREFSAGVAVPGLEPPVRARSFGFAFLSKSTGESVASCGCFAQ